MPYTEITSLIAVLFFLAPLVASLIALCRAKARAAADRQSIDHLSAMVEILKAEIEDLEDMLEEAQERMEIGHG